MTKETAQTAFGPKLKALLGLKGLNQSLLAKRCKVHKSVLYKFLTGETDPRTSHLLKILRGLGIDMENVINEKINEYLAPEIWNSKIGNPIEKIISKFDRLTAITVVDSIITNAKKIKNSKLDDELNILKEYRKKLKVTQETH